MPERDLLLDRMEHFLRSRLSEEAYTKNKRQRPSLTISRECGAGMDKIGGELVDYLSEVDDSTDLGWALFNQGTIGKIIEDHNLPKNSSPFLNEKSIFPIAEALEQLLNLHPTEWTLFNYSADTIRNLCRMGNAVIVGRAGNFITADLPYSFHVRLVGSPAKRIAHIASRHRISIERATEVVQQTDKSREKLVRRYANVKIEDPRWYHLVLNTDDISAETTARIIGDSLLEWTHQKESQSKKSPHEQIT